MRWMLFTGVACLVCSLIMLILHFDAAGGVELQDLQVFLLAMLAAAFGVDCLVSTFMREGP